MKKLRYTQPTINVVEIDLKISLQLNSTPPEMDNEKVYNPIFKTNNMA